MDFSKMLKQAQEMQQKMMEAKDGLKKCYCRGCFWWRCCKNTNEWKLRGCKN